MCSSNSLVAAALDKHQLRGAGADPKTPVILQTFSEPSARKLAAMKIGVPVVLLLSNGSGWESAAKVQEWKGIVQGPGSEQDHPRCDAAARAVGARRGTHRGSIHFSRSGARKVPDRQG